MILVDVIFPEFDKTIDFQLNEDVRVWDIADEIATMVATSMGRTYSSHQSAVRLYSADRQRLLDPNCSLRENGVRSGERLLFI